MDMRTPGAQKKTPRSACFISQSFAVITNYPYPHHVTMLHGQLCGSCGLQSERSAGLSQAVVAVVILNACLLRSCVPAAVAWSLWAAGGPGPPTQAASPRTAPASAVQQRKRQAQRHSHRHRHGHRWATRRGRSTPIGQFPSGKAKASTAASANQSDADASQAGLTGRLQVEHVQPTQPCCSSMRAQLNNILGHHAHPVC